MYRKILLCYDGTDQAREALRQGADLALAAQAEVHLMAIVAPELGESLAEGGSPSGLADLERKEVQRILNEGASQPTAQRPGGARAPGLRQRCRRDRPAGARGRRRPDRLGHREQSPFARWWRGSVGIALLSRAPCSVLVAVSNDVAPPRRAA